MSSEQENIKFERDATYKSAWKLQSDLMRLVRNWSNMSKMPDSVYYHIWYMILTKWCRLLFSPNHLDSWRDIIGYCQLAIDDIGSEAK